MKHILWSVLTKNSPLLAENILVPIAAAAILGCVIYLSYRLTHSGVFYSKKFNVSLLALTILTATAVTVIGSNLALALTLAGVLSIIRFGHAINDSRDAVYLFWAVIVGLCCGAGSSIAAAAGTIAAFLVLLVLGRARSESRVLLIIRGSKSKCLEMEGLVFDFFNGKAMLKVKNTTPDTAELIFEMPRSAYQVTYQRDRDITDKLYALGGVESVNIVTQSDEITG